MTVALGPSWLAPDQLLATFGLIGLLVVIFAECGLLVGFFLPGDTLLFSAGVIVAENKAGLPHSVWLVSALAAAAAVLGNWVGYVIGYRAGPAVFNKPDSRLFKHEHVERASRFFERWGAHSIVLARFVPVVRTFITVMAGASRMPLRQYLLYSLVGGVAWAFGVTLLGYFIGPRVPFIGDHIDLILLGAVLLSVVPIGFSLIATRRKAPGRQAERSPGRVADDVD